MYSKAELAHVASELLDLNAITDIVDLTGKDRYPAGLQQRLAQGDGQSAADHPSITAVRCSSRAQSTTPGR